MLSDHPLNSEASSRSFSVPSFGSHFCLRFTQFQVDSLGALTTHGYFSLYLSVLSYCVFLFQHVTHVTWWHAGPLYKVSMPFLIPSGNLFLWGIFQLPLRSPNSATKAPAKCTSCTLPHWEGPVSPWLRRKPSTDLFPSRATSFLPPPAHVTKALTLGVLQN